MIMRERRFPKMIYTLIPNKRRKEGRPRKRWKEEIRTGIVGRNLQDEMWGDKKADQ